jgi:hypothetical protein
MLIALLINIQISNKQVEYIIIETVLNASSDYQNNSQRYRTVRLIPMRCDNEEREQSQTSPVI